MRFKNVKLLATVSALVLGAVSAEAVEEFKDCVPLPRIGRNMEINPASISSASLDAVALLREPTRYLPLSYTPFVPLLVSAHEDGFFHERAAEPFAAIVLNGRVSGNLTNPHEVRAFQIGQILDHMVRRVIVPRTHGSPGALHESGVETARNAFFRTPYVGMFWEALRDAGLDGRLRMGGLPLILPPVSPSREIEIVERDLPPALIAASASSPVKSVE